jgi:hypothetical protein
MTSSESLFLRQQEIDTTIRNPVKPLSFKLTFQSFTVWLMALDPPFVESITFPSYRDIGHLYRSLADRNLDVELVCRCLSRFGSSRLCFQPSGGSFGLLIG